MRRWCRAHWVVLALGWVMAGAPAAADPDALSGGNEEKINALEEKISSVAGTLESLRADLDALRREAGLPASGPRSRGGEVLRADYIGEAGDVPFYRVRASAPVSAGSDEPPTEAADAPGPDATLDKEEVPQNPEPPIFTPAFLRDARALLLPRNALEVEPGILYTDNTRNSLTIRGLDIINTIFIGTINVQKLKRRTITPYLQLRYGILADLQMGARFSAVNVKESLEFPQTIQSAPARTNLERKAFGIGDFEADLAWNALHESGWIPDLILTGMVKGTTGTNPFEIKSNAVATGSGFWGVRGGFTVVKVSDPATLFASASYFYHMPKTYSGFKFDPPDSIDLSAGLGYALNPVLSLTSRVETRFIDDTTINGRAVSGSGATVAVWNTGIAYGYSRSGSFQFSVGFGLTEDSPDFDMNFSLPFVFSLPQWWN
jgi:hypothetical protein